MTLRDTRRNQAYFSKLVNDLDEALEETQGALDAGSFKTPTERVDVALRLFQLSVMRVVAQYSNGVPIEKLALNVFSILPYRQQLTRFCDELPLQHQFYRDGFEKLGDADDACGSPNINRYIYTLWWLAFLEVCAAPRAHVQAALSIIGEQGKDALLDKIAIRLGDINRPISSTLYYPEVYQTLSDAFDADVSEQPRLLNQFMTEWYENLEDADWYENHDCDLEFEYTDYYIGYWSFEHVLVANLLNLPKKKLAYHPMVAIDLIDELTMMNIALFTRENDVSSLFIAKWGSQYTSKARDFWLYVREVYKTNKVHSLGKDELTFALCYDYAVGGHVNSIGDPLPFYKWVFEQIQLADEAVVDTASVIPH